MTAAAEDTTPVSASYRATPDLDLDPLLDANITFHGVLIQDDGDRTRRWPGALCVRSIPSRA